MTTAQNPTAENTVANPAEYDPYVWFFDFTEGKLRDIGKHEDDVSAFMDDKMETNWMLSESQLIGFHQFITQELSKEISDTHPAWFALTKGSKLVCIGHFPSLMDAEKCGIETHWIFSYESLIKFQKEIEKALGTTTPGSV